MTAADDFVRENQEYARTAHEPNQAMRPTRKVAVITCMDARVDVYRVLGLELGEAHVIRNAGGVVTDDVIRSLVISQELLGTEEIVLVHHTNCGMLGIDEDAVKATIQQRTGIRPHFALESFPEPGGDVRQSMARLKANPFLHHKSAIRGFIYDVETGLLTEVT